MATKIELDYKRLMTYQKISGNLTTVAEFFRHGDALVREVNGALQVIKFEIDEAVETSFTKQDFNDLLNLRNNTLYPIFQNASFAVQFDPYDVESGTIVEEFTPIITPPVEVPVEESPVIETPIEEPAPVVPPIEEVPVVEAPVEETPVVEAPVEEVVIEDLPIETP